MEFRNRVKELRTVRASELQPHPKNWRAHSNAQKDAIRGILQEVGFAGAELVIEKADGSLMLIDGHARAGIAGDAEVPVLVLDLTEEEAEKVLATYDPIGAMATISENELDDLLASVQFESQELQELIESLQPDKKEKGEGDSGETLFEQAVQLKPKREFIVIVCDNDDEQLYLAHLLDLKVVRRGGYKADSPFDSRSTERVVTAKRLMEAINARSSAE
jgi:hypothetical protein